MPAFFLPVPEIPQYLLAQDRKRQDIGGLEVKYEQIEFETSTGRVTFLGSIVAKYDETVINCDRLSLSYETFEGVAEGGVELVDPEAYMNSERLEFNWKSKSGHAKDVYVRIGNMRMWAKDLAIEQTVWVMDGMSATLSRRTNPNYKINARRMRIYPGKYGIANSVSLDLFGLGLGTVPEMRLDLDPRIDGFNLPSLADKRGVGFGMTWTSSFLLKDNVVLGANWDSFPRRSPGYGIELTYMNADPDKTFNKVKPRDDLKEQMDDGWFDNISVRSPLQESGTIGNARTLYTLGSVWNTSTFGRQVVSNDVSKEVEGIFDTAGKTDGFSARLTARLQRIRQDSISPFVDRSAVRATVQTPVLRFTESLGIVGRADLFGTSSRQTDYAWLRGQAALLWNPIQGLTLGAAYSSTQTHGEPDFLLDAPLYKEAFHARMDALFGPYTFRYLVKINPKTGVVFDKEYELALVAESFQPFIIVRELPSDYRLGFRFRIDDFVSRLQRRKVVRTIGKNF